METVGLHEGVVQIMPYSTLGVSHAALLSQTTLTFEGASSGRMT